MRAKLEILVMVLGFLGLLGTITITALPMWRVTAFISANLIVTETLWEGLWMNCYRQANTRMQCKVYDSLLLLPSDLQAARGLMCLSVAVVFVAFIITRFGIRDTNCCRDNVKGNNITLAVGGCLYLLSCLTTLIPVSWTGHTIIRDFYNPQIPDSQKRELGEALYIGGTTAAIVLITGVLLLYCYRSKDELPYTETYVMTEKDELPYTETYVMTEKDELPYTETYVMTEKDVLKEDNPEFKQPSSLYKHQQYV